MIYLGWYLLASLQLPIIQCQDLQQCTTPTDSSEPLTLDRCSWGSHPSLTNNGSWLHLGGTVAKPLFSPLMPPLWTLIYHSSSRGFSAWLYYAYQQSDVSTIGDILGHRRLSLNGHVARLDPGVPAHDALHLMVDNL